MLTKLSDRLLRFMKGTSRSCVSWELFNAAIMYGDAREAFGRSGGPMDRDKCQEYAKACDAYGKMLDIMGAESSWI